MSYSADLDQETKPLTPYILLDCATLHLLSELCLTSIGDGPILPAERSLTDGDSGVAKRTEISSSRGSEDLQFQAVTVKRVPVLLLQDREMIDHAHAGVIRQQKCNKT